MIGTKLAHYEITSHLGSGGMGDVYQATDSKLGRSVAIKLLPEAFARDADRVARFDREARVLASLNHPQIAAIYGIEESADGLNVRKFLVMELAAGETLAARIARGPIHLDEALAIAKQIAEALEAAHEKGVVHRDLKPANVKVSADGRVKVLDFGLAKAFAGEAADASLSNSPTVLSMAGTNAGVILGTAAYMSPEQARGIAVDSRTDIFAFGAVLYEMLTGRQAFAGETVSDILAAVLKVDPDWSRLPAATPPAIRRLLRRCLRKDRNRRLHTAADARIEIEEVHLDPERTEKVALVAPSQRRPKLAWIVAAVFVIATAALAIPVVVHFREAPASAPPEMRLDVATPATANPTSFAISPDGQRLVFVAPDDGQLRLWLRPLDSTSAQPLAGTDGAQYPFWSPDSRTVGFFADRKLKRIDIGGGLPQTLANAVAGRGGAWSPEGVILFAPGGTGGELVRIPSSGGEAVPVTKVDRPRQVYHRFPGFLPDGRQFLFFAGGAPEGQGIYIGSLDSSETRRLTPAETAGAYAPPGWLLYVRQGTLIARRWDTVQSELTGDPVTVADGVGFNTAENVGAFSVSATGLVSYRSGRSASLRQLVWFDRSGKTLGSFGAVDDSLLSPELAPDGLRVASSRSVAGNEDVWILDAARATRFTFDESIDQFPIWSPDGRQVVFDSNRTGAQNLYRKPSNGAGSEELLLESVGGAAYDWSPDGRFILYTGRSPQTLRDLWVLPLEGEDGDRKPTAFLKTNSEERLSQFSPDGRWVAYVSNESGRYEIYVRPFPGPGGQWQVSTSGGSSPRWAPDGKELYYIAPDGKLIAAPIAVSGETIQPGSPAVLFQTRILGGGVDLNNKIQYDVAPDGRFLINVTAEDAASSPITVLLNWKALEPF